ncbi:Fe-S cluster assembly protein SufD [soil metagenome]
MAELATTDWLSERRQVGASRAQELELPGPKAKGWEFTDLSGLDLDSFAPVRAEVAGLDSVGGDGAEGPIVMPLAEAAEKLPELVRERLGSLVAVDDAFVSRNESNWQDGVLVYVPRGVRLESPVQLEISPQGTGGLAWRSLVVLDEGAEAEVWERYSSDDGDEGLFNGVTELIVGDAANLRYVCQQDLSESSWAFATQRAEIGRDASLEWVALGFGAAGGKIRMDTKLAGRGSHAKVTGAYAGSGTQHLDYDTRQEHAAPDTNSDLAFRGVLSGSATSVWSGMVRVDPAAQRTDAFQESRNLILSPKAHADAIPGLEIEADDVRCTHAAAVAQVDPDQLFYLQSRGLPDAQAKRLVIDGFLQEMVERTAEGPIRDVLTEQLERRLGELLPA